MTSECVSKQHTSFCCVLIAIISRFAAMARLYRRIQCCCFSFLPVATLG